MHLPFINRKPRQIPDSQGYHFEPLPGTGVGLVSMGGRSGWNKYDLLHGAFIGNVFYSVQVAIVDGIECAAEYSVQGYAH
jgi:hypothetical protein